MLQLDLDGFATDPDTSLTEEMWWHYSCDDGEECVPDDICEG